MMDMLQLDRNAIICVKSHDAQSDIDWFTFVFTGIPECDGAAGILKIAYDLHYERWLPHVWSYDQQAGRWTQYGTDQREKLIDLLNDLTVVRVQEGI
jgi:hypothetical protein